MNIFKVVFKDLKNFIFQKKYIFSILLMGLIVASYALSFFTAQSLHIIEIIDNYFGYSTKYYIGGNKNAISYDKFSLLYNWLEENELNNSKINIYSEMILMNKTEEYNDICLVVGTNSTKSKRIDFVGEVISQDDLSEKRDYALIEYYSNIVPEDVFLIGSKINLKDKSYTVKAIDKIDVNKKIYFDCNTKEYYVNDYESRLSSIAIPYTTFIEHEYGIFAIEIIFEQPLNEEQQKDFNNFIEKEFNTNTIVKPVKENSNNISSIKNELMKYAIIILLALINIMALFSYWIDKNWRNYMIYKLCGANNQSIYMIISLEAIIISVISCIFGIILYYLTVPLLQKIYISYVLSLKEIIYIQSIVVLLVFILTNINIIQIFKRNSKYIERN